MKLNQKLILSLKGGIIITIAYFVLLVFFARNTEFNLDWVALPLFWVGRVYHYYFPKTDDFFGFTLEKTLLSLATLITDIIVFSILTLSFLSISQKLKTALRTKTNIKSPYLRL